MSNVILRKYGEAATFNFDLFGIDGIDFKVDAVHVAGDTKIMKDEGVEANTTNGFVDEGQGYSITLTATEMEHARGRVYIVDQGTKAWLDTGITIETYGHASAQFPYMNEGVYDRVLTSGTHNVNNSGGKRIRDLKEQSLYEGGVLYIDTVSGTAGSESYVNGTLDNPVDNIADLNTLASALNISSFKVAAGSTITFAAAQEKQNFIGNNWTLALGGQSINGSYIEGAACSGIGLAATVNPVFVNCKMNGSTIPANTECYNSNLDGDLILGGAGTFILERCYSLGSPSIDFGAAIGNTTVNMGHYAGNIEFKNIGQLGTDLVEIEGNGDITLNANCIGGSLNWAGHFRLTDNSGDSVTITGDNIDVAVKAMQGTTFSAITDSLEAIRNQGDAAWITGAGSIASVILAEKLETLLDINKPLDLTVTTTTRLQYQWLDIDGDPVNIAGSTFKFKAVKNAGETSPAIAEVTGTIDDAVNGRFYFDVLPTTTFKGRYEIWAVDGASKITTLTKAGGSKIETHPRL
jgi:hypothetical protein